MDRLSGDFGHSDPVDFDEIGGLAADSGDDEIERQDPPPEIGQDERRMQVRAYNYWAGLLADRNFPSIEELDPEDLPDFGPHSVLLDFTDGIDDPAVPHLGEILAEECGTDSGIGRLSQVPSRSLLSRITDHYMQILANQAPIGFEAEFVNQRGATILYRGILLPFSSDDESIDFIYGVINWKEMADQITTDELLLEIDQVLETGLTGRLDEENDADQPGPPPAPAHAMDDWADGPGSDLANDQDDDSANEWAEGSGNALSHLSNFSGAVEYDDEAEDDGADFPQPAFGSLSASMAESKREPLDLSLEGDLPGEIAEGAFGEEPAFGDPQAAPMPEAYEPQIPQEDEQYGLYDCLAAARESAHAARSCEDRSRSALYEAVGRAYDVSLAAAEEPQEFTSLVEENGLSVQERAPMTPVVKLVFGADYDKTRLTEYAAVLGHAHRIGIERGALSGFLKQAEGGLKGVVSAERRLRKEESGKAVEPADAPRSSIARKLRKLDHLPVGEISAEGPEFALVLIRRLPDGSIGMLGEIGEDIPLVERAARKLLDEKPKA